MVWEDVHWSDPTTRESLDLLIDRVATLRVLVIITFRPEFTLSARILFDGVSGDFDHGY